MFRPPIAVEYVLPIEINVNTALLLTKTAYTEDDPPINDHKHVILPEGHIPLPLKPTNRSPRCYHIRKSNQPRSFNSLPERG